MIILRFFKYNLIKFLRSFLKLFLMNEKIHSCKNINYFMNQYIAMLYFKMIFEKYADHF